MNDKYSVNELIARGSFKCGCGKTHSAHLKEAIIEKGAVEKLSQSLNKLAVTKPFIIADKNTFAAAGEKVIKNLKNNNFDYSLFIYEEERPEPDEKRIGSVFLHFDFSCDGLIAIGSGVINDIGKILALAHSLPSVTVGTAPSMDGYASSTSSVIRDGLKVSVTSKCPDIVIGDLDILCKAPVKMLCSGLGDMLAKYISVCEWRIGAVVTGEYYCEEVAAIIRAALKKCVDNADGIPTRSPEAVKSVMEGMVISGIAADYAGISRPVSGIEHYFSHLWDMRSLEFGTPMDLHGIQCGIGTLLALKGYDYFKGIIPEKEKGAAYANAFEDEKWFDKIKEYVGTASAAMIKDAKSSLRYNRADHEKRLNAIIDNKEKIAKIISEELPDYEDICALLRKVGAPCSPDEIGIPLDETALTFKMTRDIRDKYILSSLMWDLGIIDEAAESVY